MSRRPPAPPPDLPGYTVIKLLGSGGFADVYRYEQHLPRRSVAVKVLIPGSADTELLAQFDAEANLMAALSTHPAIVTIHQAGISADGRPYMVMEYCSRPNLSQRYRAERMSTADVLRVGIRLSGAVETAHRAGILHRDIKPANVLTTDFGHPVLSDFGISVQASVEPTNAGGGSVGMSIPWSPPEVFDEHVTGDERADVYSLAATLYTLLARRSPFDRPGGPNTSSDLINRIRNTPLPALGRTDVPQSLERVIARAMDKNRAARYATALDFGRALQLVEGELRLAPTPVDVLDEDPDAAAELADSPATRVRALTVIEAQPSDGTRHRQPTLIPGGITPPPAASIPQYQRPLPTGQRGVATAPPARTGGPGGAAGGSGYAAGQPGSTPEQPMAGPPVRRSKVPYLVMAALLVGVLTVVGIVLGTGGTAQPQMPSNPDNSIGESSQAIAVPGGQVVEPVVGLSGSVVGGSTIFTWTAPDRQPGDYYSVEQVGGSGGKPTTVTEPAITFADSPDKLCVVVKAVRNGAPSDGARACNGAN